MLLKFTPNLKQTCSLCGLRRLNIQTGRRSTSWLRYMVTSFWCPVRNILFRCSLKGFVPWNALGSKKLPLQMRNSVEKGAFMPSPEPRRMNSNRAITTRKTENVGSLYCQSFLWRKLYPTAYRSQIHAPVFDGTSDCLNRGSLQRKLKSQLHMGMFLQDLKFGGKRTY